MKWHCWKIWCLCIYKRVFQCVRFCAESTFFNWTACFKKVNNCINTNIYSYLETFGGQSSNPYLNVVNFWTPELIRNLWQFKTAVFLHWCLICTVPFNFVLQNQFKLSNWETYSIVWNQVQFNSTFFE